MRISARFWAYATSFGAAWGIFELTVGTFLHTLKLPFAGPVLASAAAALLIAQRQILPTPGISLATGLIAAACKSISPDGTVFGPMIGILSEALSVELAFGLFSLFQPFSKSTPFLAAPVAGSLAALCPMIQKIFGQVFLYGGHVLDLYLEIIQKLTRGSRFELLTLTQAAFILGCVFVAEGALFGIAGAWLGKRAVHELFSSLKFQNRENDSGLNPNHLETKQTDQHAPRNSEPINRRTNQLIASAAIVSLVIQFKSGIEYALVALLIMIVTLAFFERRTLSRIWRPKFWLVSLVLVTASGLLLGKKDLTFGLASQPWASTAGFTAGLLMLIRAAWILSLTAWISTALTSATVLKWAKRLGFEGFGTSLSSAFGIMNELRPHALPLTDFRSGKMIEHVIQFIVAAAQIAERSASAQSRNKTAVTSHRPLIVAIIGGRHSGKTHAIMNLSDRLIESHYSVAGICQPAVRGLHGSANGYDLLNLATQVRRSFARKKLVGLGYHFESSGWNWASEQILAATSEHKNCNSTADSPHFIFIDELGRLEARKKGHFSILQELLRESQSAQRYLLVLGIQKSLAPQIIAHLGGIDEAIVVDSPDFSLDRAFQRLMLSLKNLT